MNLFGNKSKIIKAPVSGIIVDLSEVNDPVFSQGMMGPGFAIKDHNGNVCSPITGIVESVFPTKHAITLGTKSGLQILLHLGVDTVELSGKPFEVLVSEGQKISEGEKIVNMDLEMIKESGKDSVIMVVFPDQKPGKLKKIDESVVTGEPIYQY